MDEKQQNNIREGGILEKRLKHFDCKLLLLLLLLMLLLWITRCGNDGAEKDALRRSQIRKNIDARVLDEKEKSPTNETRDSRRNGRA